MNAQNLIPYLTDFLATELEKTGADAFVVGVSGGLDSAVVSALCALTEIPTHALIMPMPSSNLANLGDAIEHCDMFGINYEIQEIAPFMEAFASLDTGADKLRTGNFATRVRMGLLYDYSAKHRAVVVGTTNLSERMLGYSTIYGDLACAFNPIGEILKTKVSKLAEALTINENIIAKTPSADLWENQSDERELGYSYDILDSVLRDIFSRPELREKIRSGKEIIKDDLAYLLDSNHNADLCKFITNRMIKNSFKLRMPNVAQVDPNA
ncbi:NAD(+) synthase [Campylobacter sp. VBCF_06 NA8]|uniref:NAD(+) synthase n=1 Tax=Campylobacter sp. VBCF_06 NA8 TaxID=2983822 RepID=UPI0022E9C18E|nr:NAD(+) synthase [Campylobacter sp. VBCF_06 NA8]MDA3046442.1 NAD(+) synthase [Campylobacter sp. VBCF_06 NA8]